uniref:Uncharacterized protein AlNc14C439G11655 n=1 Tax=Albugo laibachii Nc14 TaxID=890382 RepID=F0WZR4_9STRA|nr:conserved hypothetical protein [Albugo laibachii Nc14]|eukprot:CCA26991.1 conserved hypothetical protein [Albugo laibachii Nc14]
MTHGHVGIAMSILIELNGNIRTERAVVYTIMCMFTVTTFTSQCIWLPTTNQLKQLQQLQHKNSELDGLVQIAKSRLAQVEEENFELCANIATIEAEKQYEIKKNQEALQKENEKLNSKLQFLENQIQHTQREKKSFLSEISALKKQRIEKQRMEAERKLAEARQRKHKLSSASTSQVCSSKADRNQDWVSQTPSQHISTNSSLQRTKNIKTISTGIQANPTDFKTIDEIIMQENMELITAFMTPFSTDLLALFDIPYAELDPQFGEDVNACALVSEEPSRSVFTQVTEHAKAKLQSWVTEHSKRTLSMQANVMRECAKHLHAALGMMMMEGELFTSVNLLPVFIRYFDSRVDIDPHVLSSAFRLLSLVITKSEIFQHFLAEDNSIGDLQFGGSRLEQSDTGIRNPMDYSAEFIHDNVNDLVFGSFSHPESGPFVYPAAARHGISYEHRSQLLEAICRIIKIHSTSLQVAEEGLRCLSSWVHCVHDIDAASLGDYKRLLHSHTLQDIVMGPKSFPQSRAQALRLLAEIITINPLFPTEFEESAQKYLFFNRCANLLHIRNEREKPDATTAAERLKDSDSDSQVCQGVILLFLKLILHHPVSGIRFVLRYTRGDEHGVESSTSLFTLVLQFLKYYITLMEDAAETSKLIWTKSNKGMVEDAFQLLNVMIPHIHLEEELSIGSQEYDLLICLRFLCRPTSQFSATAVKSASQLLEMLSRLK